MNSPSVSLGSFYYFLAARAPLFAVANTNDHKTVNKPQGFSSLKTLAKTALWLTSAPLTMRDLDNPHMARVRLHSQQQVAAVNSLQHGAGSWDNAATRTASCSGVSVTLRFMSINRCASSEASPNAC